MLRARNAPRMPPDCPLPEADIELVERWILNGAPEHGYGPTRSDGAGNDAADARKSDAAGAADAHGPADAARDLDGWLTE